MRIVEGSKLSHECGVDCDLQYSDILQQHIHVMHAAEPNSAAGRYQFDENQRILRMGAGARKAWRASGQVQTRRNRVWDRDRRTSGVQGMDGVFVRIGSRYVEGSRALSPRRIYRAVAAHWTFAEDLPALVLSVTANIERQVRFYQRHGRFTDGGFYAGLGGVSLEVEQLDGLIDAHTD